MLPGRADTAQEEEADPFPLGALTVRDTEQIDDPSWQDIQDRDSEIRRLKQEIDELRAELRERDQIMHRLNERATRLTALLGVP